jgi:hypothetical protein
MWFCSINVANPLAPVLFPTECCYKKAESSDAEEQDLKAAQADWDAKREALVVRERQDKDRWMSHRVLFLPGSRQAMRLLVCPALEDQQCIVSLTWNPAYTAVLRLNVLAPWGKRCSALSPETVCTDNLATDLLGRKTDSNNFSTTNQPRVVMGSDEALQGGPVLASMWSHADTGIFKISIGMSLKSASKDITASAAKAATPNRRTFFQTTDLLNSTVGNENSDAPKDVQDQRLQIQLQVFSHSGGLQIFEPAHQGFFRKGEWYACTFKSHTQDAQPFLDGDPLMTKVEDAISEDDISTAWNSWKTFKRSGVGLDEDINLLKSQIFKSQAQLIDKARAGLELSRSMVKKGNIDQARESWVKAQELFLQAGVIGIVQAFDTFSTVPGHMLPAAEKDESEPQNGNEVLIEKTTAITFIDQICRTRTEIANAQILLRVLRRMNSKLMIIIFDKWSEFVVNNIRLKTLGCKMVKRMQNLGILRCFSTWEHWWNHAVRGRQLLFRMKRMCVSTSFRAWSDYVLEMLEDRHAEKSRLMTIYNDAQASLKIAKDIREGKELHPSEQKCYNALLILRWDADDLLATVSFPRKGMAFVGFEASKVDDVNWELFTARAAEKQKIRPAVFPKLAEALQAQATHFLQQALPARDEFHVDVAQILRFARRCVQTLRTLTSESRDVEIVDFIGGVQGHVREMMLDCRRLARSAVEVWRRAQWMGEVSIQKSEDLMLKQQPLSALNSLAEARKRCSQRPKPATSSLRGQKLETTSLLPHFLHSRFCG